ncbi:MAG: hypothetical protein AMJ61_07315 [Desulfobacterales bacterium SG8_35_2]|nr:MAG: hypothetical protein AMJ61_07315 [Desulfobacterales bacterium SG8_35_2]
MCFELKVDKIWQSAAVFCWRKTPAIATNAYKVINKLSSDTMHYLVLNSFELFLKTANWLL